MALTSVGAGALGSVLLLFLYPLRMTPHRLVATDIVHAIPLAVVAGLGSGGAAGELAGQKNHRALDSDRVGAGPHGGRRKGARMTFAGASINRLLWT